jgi:hypothetical protein
MRDFQGRFLRKREVALYQADLMNRLGQIFNEEQIEMEWSSMQDEYDLTLYSPRIDLAVGPFATNQSYGLIYNRMLERVQIREFITRLVEFNRRNLNEYGDFVRPAEYDEIVHMNFNSRCFMAIEIENNVSRKHLMGGAINASALGRLGVVIPWSNEKLRAFVKLVRYLHYLRYADKNTFNTSNLLIITREQMDIAIEESLDRSIAGAIR